MKRRLFILAGEASGDLHASRLASGLLELNPELSISGWGGDLMAKAGVRISKHYRELAFMGFAEVLANIRTILRNFRQCKKEIISQSPDALILVDYPGFNLRIARFAHKLGIPVFYYISPQVWAWKKSRIYTIKKNISRLFVILPFEKEFYDRHHIDVEYYGHPLTDLIAEYAYAPEKLVAILPGSRKQEVDRMLPAMLEATRSFPGYRFVVAGTSVLGADYYQQFLRGYDVELVTDSTYSLLRRAEAAMVTSGTATLETALLGIPQVVCYKTSIVSYLIARTLVRIRFISLVNLILNRRAVEELIQDRMTPQSIADELKDLLSGGRKRAAVMESYKELRIILGSSGVSEKIASRMLELMG